MYKRRAVLLLRVGFKFTISALSFFSRGIGIFVLLTTTLAILALVKSFELKDSFKVQSKGFEPL